MGGQQDKTLDEKVAQINAQFPGVATIAAADALELRNTADVVWVDCRDKAERDVSTIANAIPEREFRPERDVPDGATVVAYCTVGYRSAQFCEKQKHLGVYNLEGGILAHVAHGGEVVGPDGKITNELHCWGPSFRRFAPPQYRTRSYSTLNSVLALPKLYLRKFFL